MTISSVLKASGHGVCGIEAKPAAIYSLLDDRKPAIVAFTSPTCYLLPYLEMARQIKQAYPSVFTVFGGWHPTYAPDMVTLPGVDAVCIGEGEWAMLELCEQLDTGNRPSGIRNLWIRGNDGEVEKNELRPLIQDLDELPLPDRDFMLSGRPEYYYVIASVVTQRSCPYACSFCVNNAFNELYKNDQPHLRRRSVDHVIGELKQVKAEGKLEFVKFEDSIFTLHRDWIREFSEKYRRDIGVPFTCFVRAETATPDTIRDIRNAGAVSVSLGVEAGDENIRMDVFNKKISDEKLKQTVQLLHEEGLKIRTHNIVGIPGYGLDADLATMRLNAELKPAYAACGFLQPYPGTASYKTYLEQGLIPQDLFEYLESMPQSYIEPAMPLPEGRERLMTRNLQRLFAIGVSFPWAIPLVRFLIRLPLTGLYRFLYAGWKSFAYLFRIWPITLKQLPVLIKRAKRMAS